MPVISVNDLFSEPPLWEETNVITEMTCNRIDIWRVSLLQNEELFNYLFTFLDEAGIEKYNRYYKEEDKKRFLISHSATRILMGKYLFQNPPDVKIKEGINKKPFVINEGEKELYYNLSHSGDWILIAVSKYDVGIDIELINSSFSFSSIVDSAFSTEESEFLKQSEQSPEAFYLLWTRKEALLKGTGKGLVDNLSDIPSLDGVSSISDEIIGSVDSWRIGSFGVEKQYVASVAYSDKIDTARFFQLTLD